MSTRSRRISFAPTTLLLGLTLVTAVGAQERPTYGTITRKDGQGKPYVLTREDSLWAARMLTGEAGGADDADNAAVLSSMINSYTLRPVREDYPTFAAFVRGYCTPLQPYLKSKGALERHRKKGTPLVEVEPGKFQLKRHVELQERPWDKLPAGARALVERTFEGKQKSVCGNATQFCSTAVYFHDKNARSPSDEELVAYTEDYAKSKSWLWVKVDKANPRNNCFFVEKRFADLPAEVVQIELKASH